MRLLIAKTWLLAGKTRLLIAKTRLLAGRIRLLIAKTRLLIAKPRLLIANPRSPTAKTRLSTLIHLKQMHQPAMRRRPQARKTEVPSSMIYSTEDLGSATSG